MIPSSLDPVTLIVRRRRISGISAVLLPFTDDDEIDWDGFRSHVLRTADAGLTPAVNMDTGFVNFLDDTTRIEVLEQTVDALGSRPFVAGAFVTDVAGMPYSHDAYLRQIDPILVRGGVPVIFPSFGLTELPEDQWVAAHARLGQSCDRFIAFELGQMFAKFGRIYSLDSYRGILKIPQCIGAKHSSLSRELEWQRIALRNEIRPDFHVFTGNDLAIDMVMYGSDYLLGLSTFAPDLFAQRDALWLAGDSEFYELNDQLQYLGFLAFRNPVPGYKQSAAMFLKLRGWIKSDRTHPASLRRPVSDLELLYDIGRQLKLPMRG